MVKKGKTELIHCETVSSVDLQNVSSQQCGLCRVRLHCIDSSLLKVAFAACICSPQKEAT